MGFGAGGKSKAKAKGHRAPIKKQRSMYSAAKTRVSTPSPAASRPAHAERESLGLLSITQEQIRTYISVAYVLRFDEPMEDDWNDIAAALSKKLFCDRRTVLKVFERIEESLLVECGVDRKQGSGRLRKLDENNPDFLLLLWVSTRISVLLWQLKYVIRRMPS